MAMSHSGLEMRRTFLNPFSNWHTSALQLVVVVAAIMLSLVSVDELPVPSDKRIHNQPGGPRVLCTMLCGNWKRSTRHAENRGGAGPMSVPNVVKPRSAIHV